MGLLGTPARVGASRSCSRVIRLMRSTQREAVRTASWCRRNAQILRQLSPGNSGCSRTARMASRVCWSERTLLGRTLLGPRLAGEAGGASISLRCLQAVARGIRQTRQTLARPHSLLGEGLVDRLNSTASAGEGGCRSPASRSCVRGDWPREAQRPWPARRPWPRPSSKRLMDEFVAVVGLPQLESGLHGDEGLVAPLGESGGGDPALPAEGIEGLAFEESQDDLGLPPRGPTALVKARPARRFGRPSASLRVGPGIAARCVVPRRHGGRDSQSGVS